MRRRNILALLMAAALCLCLLAGCGSAETTDSTGTSITEATTIADLKGMKIAAQAGTFHADALNQIENVQGSTYPEFADLLTALKSGAIDGYIAEEPTAFSVCQSDDTLTFLPFMNNETGFTATASDVGIAIGLKKGSELREQINAVLAEITPEQRSALMEQIVTLSSGGEVTEFAVSAEEPENPTGTLRVGMECAYEPYNWTDISGASFGAVPISGEGKDGLYANGYDVQIAKYVAARLGMNLEIYSIEWDSLLPALESGAIDAIAAGKEAAISLHRYVHPGQTLTAGRDRRVYKALDKDHVLIETAGFDKDHRQTPGYNAAKAKTFSDARVTFTEEQVRKECARCLGCGATKVDSYLCIGCGLCTTKCKFDAIHLKKVRDWHAGSYETMPIKVAEGVVKRAGSIVKKAVSK